MRKTLLKLAVTAVGICLLIAIAIPIIDVVSVYSGWGSGEQRHISGTIADVSCSMGSILPGHCTFTLADSFWFKVIGVVAFGPIDGDYYTESVRHIEATVEQRGIFTQIWVYLPPAS